MATDRKVEKKVEKKSDLEKKVDGLAAVLRKLKSQCEVHWGIDIDEDGKIGGVRVALLVIVLFAFAAHAYTIWSIPQPDGSAGVTIDNSGGLTVAGTLAASAITQSGASTSTGNIIITPSSVSVVANGTITVSRASYMITGTGGADLGTNTVVLSNPSAAGQMLYLSCAAGSTNLIAIADSGNVIASSGIELSTNDTAVLMSQSTSKWLLLSESTN